MNKLTFFLHSIWFSSTMLKISLPTTKIEWDCAWYKIINFISLSLSSIPFLSPLSLNVHLSITACRYLRTNLHRLSTATHHFDRRPRPGNPNSNENSNHFRSRVVRTNSIDPLCLRSPLTQKAFESSWRGRRGTRSTSQPQHTIIRPRRPNRKIKGRKQNSFQDTN